MMDAHSPDRTHWASDEPSGGSSADGTARYAGPQEPDGGDVSAAGSSGLPELILGDDADRATASATWRALMAQSERAALAGDPPRILVGWADSRQMHIVFAGNQGRDLVGCSYDLPDDPVEAEYWVAELREPQDMSRPRRPPLAIPWSGPVRLPLEVPDPVLSIVRSLTNAQS